MRACKAGYLPAPIYHPFWAANESDAEYKGGGGPALASLPVALAFPRPHPLFRQAQARSGTPPGEAYLAVGNEGQLLGYIIMCRGFSLDYGGYFTWVEETYMRKTDQRRFRDQRFSP